MRNPERIRSESAGGSRAAPSSAPGRQAQWRCSRRCARGPRAWRARSRALAKPRFKAPLRIPPVLTGAQIEIEMREAKVAVVPGRKTKLLTYGGTFPGADDPPSGG